MKRIFIIAALAMLALTSCAPDPRREADAYATRQEADAAAAANAQALQQDAEANAMKMERLREVGQFVSAMLMTTLIASMFTVFVALTSLGIGLSFVFIGGGIATAKRNLEKPNLVQLDPVTRQFPLVITKVDDGKYSLSNPNTNSVTMLYVRNEADRLMIQAMSATQYAGALGHESRMSHRPGEVAQITAPQILEVN